MPPEQTITEIIKTIAVQSPGLVVSWLIVQLFMKHLSHRQEAEKTLHAEHLDERKQCRVAIEANARAIHSNLTETQKNIYTTSANTEALNNLAHVISNKVG